MGHSRTLAAGLALSTLAACGAGVYGPSAAQLAKSMGSMSSITSESLEGFPETARGALIDRVAQNGQIPNSERLLCDPVHYVTYTSVLNEELQVISAGLSELSGDSPEDFPGLIAAAATPYTIGTVSPPGTPEDGLDTAQERADAAADSAVDICRGDLGTNALQQARDAYLEPLGTAEEQSLVGTVSAGIAVWQLVEPILSGGLRFIDQQRRASAIRRYLNDQNNRRALREAIQELQRHVGVQQEYRRRVAAAAFARAYQEAQPGGFTAEERATLLEAASLYDTISRSSTNTAFTDVRNSLERIFRVAEGRPQAADFAEAMRRLAASVQSFQKVAAQWESLEEGGENRDKWMDALRRLGLAAPAAEEGGGE